MLQHADAVEARSKTVPALATATYVGRVPKTSAGALVARPFNVIYPADGIDTQDRLTGGRRVQHPRFTMHIVGDSYKQVATLTSQLKARFIEDGFGIPLDVPGEVTRNVQWSSPEPVQWDTDVTPPVAYQVVELSFDSEPTNQ